MLRHAFKKNGVIDNETEERLLKIETENNLSIRRRGNVGKDLALALQKVYSECREDDAERVVFMPNWFKNGSVCQIEEYTEIIKAPFENTMVHIPAKYDEHLRKCYGEYTRPMKGTAIHEYPVFKAQEELLRQKLGQNPYRYTFPSNDLSENRLTPKYKDKCIELFGMIEKISKNVEALRKMGSDSEADKLLEAGKNVERVLSGMLDSSFGKRLDTGKKEVLFLPVKIEWWESMRAFYEDKLSEPDTDVYVISMDYFDKDYRGTLGKKA